VTGAATDVVTFGETMASLRGEGPLRLGATMALSVGGTETNVAIGLARLGHAVRWVGRVGDDELGALVLRTLRAEGVDVAAAQVDPERATGLMLREHRVGNVIRVQYYRSGSAGGAITADDVLPALDGARILHVTGVTPALDPAAADAVRAAIARARSLALLVSFDVNYRSRLWPPATAGQVLRPLIGDVDVLFESADELPLVADDPAELLAAGVRDVVIKHGGDGAECHTADGKVSVPARAVPVVDVVGAGDAFVAGYLSGVLDGAGPHERLERGAVAGAFVVARPGDWEGLPTRAELPLLDAAEGTTFR
jgi:2-dehydro-3-deoxygluconokinase